MAVSPGGPFAEATAVETRLAVQKLDELPAMSFAVQQLLDALDDSDVGIRDLGRIIERDPALLARIVGLANAAYYGLREPITTAEEAIFKVLGVNTAKSLALGIALSGPFDGSRCNGFRLDQYWSISISAALLAQRLARFVQPEPKPTPGEAYLCGLLHNLGLLVLVHLYPDTMARVFTDFSQGRGELHDLERAALGADHGQVGGWLTRKWHLCAAVADTLEHYLDPTYAGGLWPVVRLIGYCGLWANRLWFDGEPEEGDWRGVERLGITLPQVNRAVEEVSGRMEEIRSMARILAV